LVWPNAKASGQVSEEQPPSMLWNLAKSAGKLVISRLPENYALRRFCAAYMDKCNGEANCDSEVNRPLGTETIRIETLDEDCSVRGIEHIDFLKLDVEGHEFDAPKGARDLLASRRIKILQFEYGGTYIDARVLLKDIWSCFDGLGYCFFKLYPNRLRPYQAYGQELERFQYQNWAVIRFDLVESAE
jgi:FkbM family methyltransferase